MLVLGTFVLAAAAAGPAERAEPLPPARHECVALRVSSPQQQSRRPVFSASQILDLQLTAFFRWKLQGSHTLEFRAYTPSGHLYQSFAVPFTVPPRDPRQPHPQRPRVSATLPVAGTAIMTNSLYGQWTLAAYLDGSGEPCHRPRRFVIQY